ncbi:MAG: M16 family metallopeptidase [Candidatus Binatia bacterium]
MDGVTVESIMKQRGKTNVCGLPCRNIHRAFLAGTLVLFFGNIAAWAALDTGVTKHTLDNGLTVIVVEDHWHPLVALEVCYRVGARNDPPGKQGLSHVLEHLTFHGRGTSHAEGTAVAERNGRAYATTDHDTTCYSSSIVRDELEATLAGEAERMSTLQASAEDLAHEKTIVAGERQQLVEGDTWRNLLEEVDNAAYRLHPYRFPTSGWPETLAQITLDDVRAQFTMYYTPTNAVLVAVGDVRRQELLAMIQEFFAAIPARERPMSTRFVEPAQGGDRRLLLAPRAVPRLVAAYHTPPFSNPDRAALEVLTALLAGSDHARLPALLYTHDLAEDVGIEYNPLSHDPGLFYIKAALGPRIDFQLTGEAVDDVLWHLREDGLRAGELEEAKKHLFLNFYLERSLSTRATRLAHYALLEALPQGQCYVDEIQAVTAGDVQRVVDRYFSPRNRVLAVTGMAHQEQEREQTGATP